MATHLLAAIELLRWPVVVVVLGGLAILAFRTPLGSVIGRLTRVKAPGIEAEASEQAQAQTDVQAMGAKELPSPTDLLAAATAGNESLMSPLVIETAQLIARDPNFIATPQGDLRDALLARHLASAQIALFFERVYQYIFGGQIKALRLANRNLGTTLSELRPIFDATESSPSYTFDNFLNYLRDFSGFITIDDEAVHITERGREFLKYLVQMRYGDKGW